MMLIKEVYVYWKAEVVFITSNWQGNKEMMEGCKEAGIPAFVSAQCLFPLDTFSRYPPGNALGLLTSRSVDGPSLI